MLVINSLTLSLTTGSSIRVHQTPSGLIKKQGESVDNEICCSHSIENHDRILWYKQDRHRVLTFLGYLNLDYPFPEDDVKGKISFQGDGRSSANLSISNLQSEDSVVYFCAASQHSAADSLPPLQKPPSVYPSL